jgi:hypothetical protein
MKNYIDETFLKGFLPALTKLLWTSETNYDKQKSTAEVIVRNDFIARGYRSAFLQSPLVIRTTDVISATETTSAYEDTITRLRYVYTVPTLTGGNKTVVLQGCNTEDGTFETINTFTLTASSTTEVSGLIAQPFKYYKLVLTVTAGTLDFTFKLVESNYDLFFAYKWLELILLDSVKNEGDQYHLKMLEFREMYNDLWNKVTINEDLDEDGEVDDSPQTQIILSR